MRYGNHALQPGDRDGDAERDVPPVWGGVRAAPASVEPDAATEPGPTPHHVRQLQQDLRHLGFAIVGKPDGDFGRRTRWAVREFQAHAKLGRVARLRPDVPAAARAGADRVATLGQTPGRPGREPLSVYVASLESTPNTAVYAGAVSGVVDAPTCRALTHWLEHDYRCPVVVEAWHLQHGRRAELAEAGVNLWLHDELPDSAPRMFARDFSDQYAIPPAHADAMMVIGEYVDFEPHGGPRSRPPQHTWPEAELLPETLLGESAPAGAALSTYRVVRAVSEVECIGFADSVNCYDNAFVSVGPCHWTLGIVNAGQPMTSPGELCGYLAFLAHVEPQAFEQVFGRFGVRIDGSWVDAHGVANGAALFSSQHKYSGWIAVQNRTGEYEALPRSEEEGNYFKTWHWHYRFVMAGRTVPAYRRRMWDMARLRVRDIRRTPFGPGVANVGPRAATIGDVFSSEVSAALLLRWHIRAPAHVVSRGVAGDRLRDAFDAARAQAPQLAWDGDPSGWGDAHELALIAGIAAVNSGRLARSLSHVDAWPDFLHRRNPNRYRLAAPVAAPLSRARGSLEFDGEGLPPAP